MKFLMQHNDEKFPTFNITSQILSRINYLKFNKCWAVTARRLFYIYYFYRTFLAYEFSNTNDDNNYRYLQKTCFVAAIFPNINYLILTTILLHSVAEWLWIGPNGPCLWVFTMLCNPLPLSVGQCSTLFLASRRQQRWWNITSVMRLQRL